MKGNTLHLTLSLKSYPHQCSIITTKKDWHPLKRLIKSFVYALRGIYLTFKTERNFKIQITALCLVVASGIYLDITPLEWGILTLTIGFVLAAESFNTAIERISDEIAAGKQSISIRNIKDISAGAVLLSAISALVIGILILFIPFIQHMIELLS